MKEVKRFIIVANIKAALLCSILITFLMCGNTDIWFPIFNAITVGFIWIFMKANIKGF